ncbi:hypothetical protein BGZ88_002105 [Linnemannia elongata]|nr:hypothetical protein BGZ88_002105 [Linnemannia elongata]
MTSFLSSLGYSSSSSSTSSSTSTDTPSSSSKATDPATTSSHTSPEQQQGQKQLQQQQHTPTATEINNSQDRSDLFQQSWKSESFVGLLNLLNAEPPMDVAQTTATNNNIITSDNTCSWTALDNSGGTDWESEQLQSLLNLSDQDMDLFQGSHDAGGLLVDETASSGQQAINSSPSTTVGPRMQEQGLLTAQHQYQQQLLLHQQQQQQQQHRQSSLDGTTPTTSSRRHSSSSLTNPCHATYMKPSIPPAEIKRPDTKELFIHPGFYSLSSPSQQPQRPSSQQQQGTPVKMGMKRSFQEDDSCPTTNSTFNPSSSSASSHRHHHHGAMMQGMDLRRYSVDGYHVAAKAAAAAASSTGDSTSPAPLHVAWAYSTPPKTPNNFPTSMFHPHARASTADYSQVPPGQPYMANNAHVVASPLMSHHHHYGTGSPVSSPFQPAAHFVRSLSSPAGTKLSSAASAFTNSPTSTTGTSGSNSNSSTPRKRRASKFRVDSTSTHPNASAGMIPFDPTALLSHFGLVNTLPPPLQQQHPSTTTHGFQQPQSEHAILFQLQQQEQLQAAIRRQQQQQQYQHQQFAAAASAAIGAAGGVGSRSGSNSIAGQQNAHAFLMQHLVSDPRLSACAGLPTSIKQQHSTTAATYRRNPGEVPSSTLPPDHFIFQEATLLNRNRQQAAQQHHAQQQQQAKQAQQAKQFAQQQGGGGRARANSISPTTTGVDMVDGAGSKGMGLSGKAEVSRRRSEPANLYQQHQQQQQQIRLHQPQQTQQYQHQHHQQQQQYQLQQQQRHLIMVKEGNPPYASPVSTGSSTSACESAIPCDPIIPVTTAPTMTTAAEDVSLGGVDDAERKKASQPEVEFDMSSIANATEAVKASTTTTPVIESMPDQEVAAATIETDAEMSLTSTANDYLESEPAEEGAKSAAAEPKHQVVEQSIEQDEQREEEEEQEEKKEEEPLTAAEAFAKSLTAVTTTLDPAATQLVDQLRLQEHLRVSISSSSLLTGTPSATMQGSKK